MEGDDNIVDAWEAYGNGLYKPDCDISITPFVGKRFTTIQDGIDYYKAYANRCGFVTRMGTQKKPGNIVLFRYILCSKEGDKCTTLPESDPSNRTKKRRRCVSTRTGCKAKISLKRTTSNDYVVSKFNDMHNHPFYTPGHYQFLRPNRNLTTSHKRFLVNCQKSGVGPTVAHNICSALVGGPEYVGASLTDFRNFQRSLKIHIGEGDVQMVINTFNTAKVSDPNFYFEYDTDECDRLTRLFWSDGISQENYARFGDVVSFDTTYGTNRYSMIFGPFTGVDNHESSVTFGAALLSSEDIPSFLWLFNSFMRCFKNRYPNCIITDQDSAMKNAISQVLPDTRHRLCMWHITKKLHEKVTPHLPPDTDFYNRFNPLIWTDTISEPEFDAKWQSLITEYSLQSNPFLSNLYDIRSSWIPAYFRNVPMGMLLRTTSRSESENSAFGINTSKIITLVEFMWRYDSVVRNQRQKHMQTVTKYAADARPTTLAFSQLELEVWSIFSRKIFYKLRASILKGLTHCGIDRIIDDGEFTIYKVIDDTNVTKTVFMNKLTKHCDCTCKCLEGYGLICMHIFASLNIARVRYLPRSMVQERWCRDPPLLTPSSPNQNAAETNRKNMALIDLDIWSTVQSILAKPNSSYNDRADFLATLKALAGEPTIPDCSTSCNDSPRIENLVGIPKPPLVTVHIPKMCKNKGRARRIQSEREKAIAQNDATTHRRCSYCKEYGHNNRTCEVRIQNELIRNTPPSSSQPSSSVQASSF